MRDRQRVLALQHLLNSLEAEILAAPDDEIHQALAETALSRDASLGKVRAVVRAGLIEEQKPAESSGVTTEHRHRRTERPS